MAADRAGRVAHRRRRQGRASRRPASGPTTCEVAQIQDSESGAEIMHMAENGFCADGEQERMIQDGETEIGGRLPINTDGGLIANGEPIGASGLRQIYEVCLQLRGDAGERQVPGATATPKVGYTQVYGAPGHRGCTVLTASEPRTIDLRVDRSRRAPHAQPSGRQEHDRPASSRGTWRTRLRRSPGADRRRRPVEGHGRHVLHGRRPPRRSRAQSDLAEHLRDVTHHLHAALNALAAMAPPVVGAVRGFAAGAGLGLACAADILLVSDNARFLSAYTNVGLTPDGSTSWALPRLVGMRRALELDADQPHAGRERSGRVGHRDPRRRRRALDAEALAAATTLANGPTSSLGGAKRLIRGSFARTLELQLQLETRSSPQRQTPTMDAKASPRSSRSADRDSTRTHEAVAHARAGRTVALITVACGSADEGPDRIFGLTFEDQAKTRADAGPLATASAIRTSTGSRAPAGRARRGTVGSSGTPGVTGVVPGSRDGKSASGLPLGTGDIKIGFHYSENLDTAYNALGAQGSFVNMVSAIESMVKYVNANGGLGGKRVVPVFHGTDPLNGTFSAQAEAACTHFAQDEQVFATVQGAVLPDINSAACHEKYQSPLVWSYQYLLDRKTMIDYQDHLYIPQASASNVTGSTSTHCGARRSSRRRRRSRCSATTTRSTNCSSTPSSSRAWRSAG